MPWSTNRKLIITGLALALALFAYPLIAWAQQEVMMVGQDSSGNSRMVLVDSSGRILTNAGSSSSGSSGSAVGTHGACTNTTMNVGTTGTACPPTQRLDRSSILIQLVQSGETLTVTTDNATLATATIGAQVSSGSSYSDQLGGAVTPHCRCTAATCSVRIVQCP